MFPVFSLSLHAVTPTVVSAYVSISCVASSIPVIWPCITAARAISFGEKRSEMRLVYLLSEMASSRTFIQLMYITEKCPSLVLQNYNSFVPWWITIIALWWNNLFTLQKKSYKFTFKFTIHFSIKDLPKFSSRKVLTAVTGLQHSVKIRDEIHRVTKWKGLY